jgi:hypothetical protein
MLYAAADRQDAADAFIADDAGQRRSNRKCGLNQVWVVHIDRRVLDTDQHLTSLAAGPEGSDTSASSSTSSRSMSTSGERTTVPPRTKASRLFSMLSWS